MLQRKGYLVYAAGFTLPVFEDRPSTWWEKFSLRLPVVRAARVSIQTGFAGRNTQAMNDLKN